MPLAADPNATVDVFFLADQDLPDEKRAALVVRFMSSTRQVDYRDRLKLAQELEKADEQKKAIAALVEAIKIPFARARNFPGGFDAVTPEMLPDLLTLEELWEVAYQVGKATRLEEAKKKQRSDSQSGSGSAPSAPSAPTPGAASTSPPPDGSSSSPVPGAGDATAGATTAAAAAST